MDEERPVGSLGLGNRCWCPGLRAEHGDSERLLD